MKKNIKILILLLLSFSYSFGQVKVDLSVTPKEYTFDGVIKTVNGSNNKNIYQQSDFDTTAAGEIYIDDAINYWVATPILFLTKPVYIDSIVNVASLRVGVNRIVYLGTGALFRGTSTGAFLTDDVIVFGNKNSTIWDVKGNKISASNQIISERSNYVGFGGVGKIDSIGGINFQSVQFANCGEGIQFKDCGIITGVTMPINNDSTSNSPRASFSGDFQSISITNSPLSIQAGESALQFAPNFTVAEHVTITGNQFSNALGGEFLATAKSNTNDTIEDNLSGNIRVNTSINHGLTIEQVVELTSTLYNGYYNVLSIVDSNSFDLDGTFLGADTTDWTTGNSNDFLNANEFTFESNGDQIDTDEQATYHSDTIIPIVIPAVDSIIMIVGDSSHWSNEIEDRFSVQFLGDTAGSIRYTGVKNLYCKISAVLSVDVDGGVSTELEGYIIINNIPDEHSKFPGEGPRTFTLHPELLVLLKPNDVINFGVCNHQNTSNLEVLHVGVIIK